MLICTSPGALLRFRPVRASFSFSSQNSTSILGWFFLHFYLLFGSLFEGFFIHFPSLFRDLFLNVFFKFFLIFSISFVLGEPSPTRILLQPASVLRTFTFSEKYVFSRTPSSESIQIWLYFRIEISSIFMTFSVSIFASIFSLIFHRKWLPKWSGVFPGG